MRDAINNDERALLVAAVQAGMPWEQARKLLPGVDSLALDRNWRDTIFKLAGLADAVPEVPEEAPEPKKPKASKKG